MLILSINLVQFKMFDEHEYYSNIYFEMEEVVFRSWAKERQGCTKSLTEIAKVDGLKSFFLLKKCKLPRMAYTASRPNKQ